MEEKRRSIALSRAVLLPRAKTRLDAIGTGWNESARSFGDQAVSRAARAHQHVMGVAVMDDSIEGEPGTRRERRQPEDGRHINVSRSFLESDECGPEAMERPADERHTNDEASVRSEEGCRAS